MLKKDLSILSAMFGSRITFSKRRFTRIPPKQSAQAMKLYETRQSTNRQRTVDIRQWALFRLPRVIWKVGR